MLLAVALLLSVAGDAADSSKQRLSKLQPLVGQWRGVGQPQRGSTKGSWTESADWKWAFGADGPSLDATFTNGRYFGGLRLKSLAEQSRFTLEASAAESNQAVVYSGQMDDQGQLVLIANSSNAHLPDRISMRFTANGDRLLLLYEKRTEAGTQVRMAEVGYTRQGSSFGKAATQRECIVTGGLGTIEVTHAGKKYFVCCTGCRDYFKENPEKVLEDYAARKK